MNQDELRESLLSAVTADAEALAQRLDSLPRAARRDARGLIREAWAFSQADFDRAEGLRLARALDSALHPIEAALGDRVRRRLQQHWPLRLRCLEERQVAKAGEAAARFHDIRAARVDWLWTQMRVDSAPERPPSDHGAVRSLDFPIVDKGGRK